MSFNSRSSLFYTLNNHKQQKVKQNLYLGNWNLTRSEDLKWEPHLIKITKKKGNSTLAFLKRNIIQHPVEGQYIIISPFKFQYTDLKISENRHLPCITKFIGIHGENLIFSRNIKIFTCPAA